MKGIQKILILLLLSISTIAAQAESRKEFIRRYKHIAIQEMERTGIPASIKLAQGLLESGCGTSDLSTKAHNHFGIKCHDWTGATFHMDDDSADECFRKYEDPEQSWIDHSEFLTSRPRYAGLFDLPTTDYKAWAKGLKAAGYATNPKYADMLIKIIEEEELYQYDRLIEHPTGGAAPKYSKNVFEKTIFGKIEKKSSHSSEFQQQEEMRNGIRCIAVKKGDSYTQIAASYGIPLKKLLAYNDTQDASVIDGPYVYLKKKRNKAPRGYDFYTVKTGDTLYRIAQIYGIKLRSLEKFNYLDSDQELKNGEKIYLRGSAPLY